MTAELTPSEGAQLDQAEATIRDGLAPLDSDAARSLTQRIKANVATAWLGLLEADTRKAWAALGYANFADYVMAEFDISQTHAYRLIDHARVIEALTESDSPIGEIKESQSRVLKPVLDEHGPAVAAKVMDETKAAGKVTAETLAKTAAELGYAKVTQTTRTTEATKVEHDVDLETGEIRQPETVPPTREPEPDPIAEAKGLAAKSPHVLAHKAIERFRDAVATVEAAGGIDVILNETRGYDAAQNWVTDLEKSIAITEAWLAAIRRQHLRSV